MSRRARPRGNQDRVVRTYRRAMWAYPRAWRAVYGQEVQAVLVDLAREQGRQRADARELGSVIGNGLLLRVESLFGLWSQRTRQRAALLAAALAGVMSALWLVAAEFTPWRAGVPVTGPVPADKWMTDERVFVVPYTAGLGVLSLAAAMVGLMLVLRRRSRAGQGVFAAAAVLTAIVPAAASLTGVHRPPLFHLGLLFGLLLVAAAAPTRPTVAQRRAVASWFGLTASFAVAMALIPSPMVGFIQLFYYLPPSGEFFVSLLVSGAGVVALLICMTAPSLRVWVVPLLMVFGWWWGQAVYLGEGLPSGWMATTSAGFLALCVGVTAVIGLVSRLVSSAALVMYRYRS